MIPTAGFSVQDFVATARFAFTVYEHIQLGHAAPQSFLDFKQHVHDFGMGLQNLHDILIEHEKRVFISGIRGTTDNKVQRTLSEVVGDFQTLHDNTINFLKHYKFMKQNGSWSKRVKIYAEGSAMHREMEVLKSEYMFHTAKVNIVMEPLKFHLLSELHDTVHDIHNTVNRIENLVKNLYTQNSPLHEPVWGSIVPEESAPTSAEMSRESSTGDGIAPHVVMSRRGTGFSNASTFVAPAGNGSIGYGKGKIPMRGALPQESMSSLVASDSNNGPWSWLHEQFSAALERSVGLDQTKVASVLDLIVRWLEVGRKGVANTPSDHVIDDISFVQLCKASWLCGKLCESSHSEPNDPKSLIHPYMFELVDKIRSEFENLTNKQIKLPSIRLLQEHLSDTQVFDLGLPPAISEIFGISTCTRGGGNEREIIKLNLPGYRQMQREVQILELPDGDTIRIKDKVGHGSEWTVTSTTLKRSKATLHPCIPFMLGSGISQARNMILKNGDDGESIGFEFSSIEQFSACQAALTGFRLMEEYKQVGRITCYYHSSRSFRAKTDVYDQTSIQIWHEASGETDDHSLIPKSRQSSTSLDVNAGGGGGSSPAQLYRRFSRSSNTTGETYTSTSSTSSSYGSTTTKRTHTLLQEARIEQRTESTKLVIFARPSGVSKSEVGRVEILAMEIDAYTYIDPDLCCSGRRSGPGEPLCCLRVWIEKHPAGSSDYPFRLLGFREPALPNDPRNRLRDSSHAHGSPMLPGPGFPINVGNWNTTGKRGSGSSEKKKNEYKNQKIESLGIEFNTEKEKKLFINEMENYIVLARSTRVRYV